MKSLLVQRAASFGLATVLTFAILGGIDRLAGQQSMSAQWAAAVMAPRA
jgi:hypothetical protein